MIEPIIANPLTYEVDPTRLDENENIETNRKNLIALTGRVFDAIVECADTFPPQLRSMCHCLYQVRYLMFVLVVFWFLILVC